MPNNQCWFRAFWTLVLCSYGHFASLLSSSGGLQSSLSLSGNACLHVSFSAFSSYRLSSASSNLEAKVTASIPCIVTEFSNMMQRQYAVCTLLHVDAETSGRSPWLQKKTFYVGSTTTGIHHRQDARWRKDRCLKQGQFVNVELVMHYLHSRGPLHEVVIVPLFNLVNATDTGSKETKIIQNWRPMYNHPRINKLHPTSTFRTTKLAITALSHTTKSSRLWKKVRRRLQSVGILGFYVTSSASPSFGWDILMMLAAGGLLAFDASRRLRSSEFSHLHVYALHRLANHLEDPPRSRVKSLLKQIFRFRGMAFPRQCKPLVIPLLAHTGFKQAEKGFYGNKLRTFETIWFLFIYPQCKWWLGRLSQLRMFFTIICICSDLGRGQRLHNVHVEHYLRNIRTYR